MAIYFIRATDGTGPVKIGWTNNPTRRLGEIQLMCPKPLGILNVRPGEQNEEKQIHKHFAKLNLWGEWFEATDELMAFVLDPDLSCLNLPPVIDEMATDDLPPVGAGKDVNEAKELLMGDERLQRMMNQRWQ